MLVLVCWVNHSTSHFWSCGYKKTVLAVIHTKVFSLSWLCFLLLRSLVLLPSVDRFLAIHLHLRYQELVTHKRVVAVVILIWVLSVFLSLMVLWLPFDVSGLFMLIVGVLGRLVIVGVYRVRIYLVARRHKNQIAPRSTTICTNEGNNKCRQLVSLSLHLVYSSYFSCF